MVILPWAGSDSQVSAVMDEEQELVLNEERDQRERSLYGILDVARGIATLLVCPHSHLPLWTRLSRHLHICRSGTHTVYPPWTLSFVPLLPLDRFSLLFRTLQSFLRDTLDTTLSRPRTSPELEKIARRTGTLGDR